MKRYLRYGLLLATLAPLPCAALESATIGGEGPKAAVNALQVTNDAKFAAMQAVINDLKAKLTAAQNDINNWKNYRSGSNAYQPGGENWTSKGAPYSQAWSSNLDWFWNQWFFSGTTMTGTVWGNIPVWNWIYNNIATMMSCANSGMVWNGHNCVATGGSKRNCQWIGYSPGGPYGMAAVCPGNQIAAGAALYGADHGFIATNVYCCDY